MESILPVLAQTGLFAGIDAASLAQLLDWLAPRRRQYRAGELILLAGYEEHEIGVVLSGGIEAERTTHAGEVLPITRMGVGGIFGDVLSGSHTVSPVTVIATADCEILFFSHQRLLSAQEGAPVCRTVLLQNLVSTISDKYFTLSRRLDLLLTRRLRDRILLFLYQQGAARSPVALPMNRTALAAYLDCERSALSRELSRMQKEGILAVNKNCFTVLSSASVPC